MALCFETPCMLKMFFSNIFKKYIVYVHTLFDPSIIEIDFNLKLTYLKCVLNVSKYLILLLSISFQINSPHPNDEVVHDLLY